MTLPDGCFAQVLVDGQPRLKRARIEPREPIAKSGSGDAFLAGYVAARYEGRAPDQCLRFGVACGAESTGRLGAGLIDPREARRLMGDVELSRRRAASRGHRDGLTRAYPPRDRVRGGRQPPATSRLRNTR